MDTDKLIDASRREDPKAQMELYKRYSKAMYNIALRILNHTADAEDVMQESFLSAFRNIQTYRGEVTFGAWLKKIVINRSLDVIKSRKAMISLDAVAEMADETADMEYMDYRDLQRDDIITAIGALPDGYRVVLTLYLIEGYDHDEISEILQISNATSRTQYHRAKKKLAEKLNELKAVS
jgi:RNA polymerase sigma factor (sigma-70 family)